MKPGYRSSLRRAIQPFPKAAIRLVVLSALLSMSAIVANAQSTSVTDGKTPTGLSPGAPAGSYPLSGFENVNLYNGNLSFRLPLLNIGGRGSSGYTMMLPIEQKWIVKKGQTDQFGNKALLPSPNWWTGKKPGYGPGVLQGRRTGAYEYPGETYCGSTANVHGATLTKLTFTGADGTEYELRDQLTSGEPLQVQGIPCEQAGGARGKVFVTSDGSAATFISDEVIYDHKELNMTLENRLFYPSGYLFLKDGTRYRIDNGEVSWIRDHNGNQTTFGVNTITDSLGRIVTIAHLSGYDEIQYKGFGLTPQTIRVWYDTLEHLFRPNSGYSKQTLQSLFPLNNSPNTDYNPARVAKVELPDGRFYQFYYNPYGELARVVLPTGGAFEYDWDGITDSSDEVIFRYVTERRVYTVAGGSPENRTQYLRGNYFDTVEVNTLSPVGVLLARSLHYFFGDPFASLTEDPGTPVSASPWKQGREYKIETFEVVNGVAAGTPKQITENTWEQPLAGSTWPLTSATTESDPYTKPNDPQITQTVNTLADTNQVDKQKFAYDRYGNRTDVYEFDYGAGAAPVYPVRHTHVDYLTANIINGLTYNYDTVNPSTVSPDAALTIHIRGLASGQKVYAVNPGTGAETLKAQSEVKYDESSFPLLPYGTVTSWSNPGTPGRGLTTTTRSWLNTTNTWLESHSQYDQCGSVRKTWDARDTTLTNPSQVSYLDAFSDNMGRNTYAFPTTVTTAVPDSTGAHGSSAAFTSTTVYDFSTGLVPATVDPNNVSTTFAYDEFLNRPKRAVRAAGTGLQTQVTIDYNDVSHVITTTSDQVAYNDNLLKSQTLYDGLGRTTEARQYEGGTNYIASLQEYDALGRSYRTSNPFRPWKSETPIWTVTGFDGVGRVHTVTTPDSAVVTTDYSGATITVTDQAGKQRRSVSDGLGRLVRVDEPDPNGNLDVSGVPAQSTSYSYDTLDNLTTVTQGTQTRTFVYDSLKRLQSATNPESGTICYGTVVSSVCQADGYDANGNLLYKTDARGVQSAYGYDALNRNTMVSYTNDAAGTPAVTRFYDAAANGKGKLWKTETSGAAASRTTIAGFDVLGRPTGQSQQFYSGGVWSAAYTVSATYNLANQPLTQTYPSGHTVNYVYDTAGRTSTFTGTLGDNVGRTYANEFEYTAMGGVQQEKFGTDAALYHKQRFNQRGQLWDMRLSTVPFATDPANGDRGSIANYYSNNFVQGGSNQYNSGNLLRQEIYIPASSFFQDNFTYDSLNRLKSVAEKLNGTGSDTFKQTYTFDRWGNRSISTSPSETYGGVNNLGFEVQPATNRLYAPGDLSLADAARRMQYDSAGNLKRDTYTGAGDRTYDAENRMTKAWGGNNQWQEYTYNADGQRVRRKVDGGETWQVYGVDGELLAEYAANAGAVSPQKENGYRNGQLLISADASALPAVPVFSDNFNDNSLDPTKWSIFDPTSPATVSEQAQQLRVTLAPNTAAYNGVFSNSTYDMRGKTVQVEVAQTVSQAGWSENYLQVMLNSQNYYLIDVGTASMVFRSMVNGVNDQLVIGYDPTALPYWRLRHDQTANTVSFETSSNGINWTTRKTVTAAFSLAAVRFYLMAGAWGTGNGSPGAAKYDNFQLAQSGAPPAPVTNLALNKPATQISEGFGGVASRAVDGNTNGNFNGNSVTHTISGTQDWWQVDLGGSYALETIKVWNRTDCCSDRLSNFYVFVSDQPFTSYDLTTTLNQSGVSNFYTAGQGGSPTFINLNRTGRYVRVQLSSSGVPLSLAEVEVMGSTVTLANINWLVTDQLGTPRMVFDKTGALATTKRHDYLPFGEELFGGTVQNPGPGGRTDAQGYVGGDGVRQKFTRKERDIETGLDFFEARYYGSTQGRFTSTDPLMASATPDNPQSWNRYSYTFNNPLAFIDPDGRKARTDDYYADRDGEITIDETPGTTDRFYVQNADQTYALVATLQRNNAGLVLFPDNGTGFDRYGTVDAGGTDRATGEVVGQGDHYLQPVAAAALFGLTNVLNSNNNLTVSLGDMSSSNGSDPWQPGQIHHAGHGHNGNRSGVDADFRYLNNAGVSFQSQTARSDAQFSVQDNQTVYDTARTFGFTTNYQGTNRGNNGEIQGVTRAGGHNDHGHLGFNRADANIFRRTMLVTRP